MEKLGKDSRKFLNVTAIDFKREKESNWERGIIINGDMVIIDADGKIVDPNIPIWNFRRCEYRGLAVFDVSND